MENSRAEILEKGETPMLRTEALTYAYDRKKVTLREISIDFTKGKVIGLIGRNGSGKSTLLLNLVGVLKPTSGRVFYGGRELEYNKKSLYAHREKIGIVFQDPDKQIFYSDVYEDMAFALRNLGLNEGTVKRRIDEALEKVDGLHLKREAVQFLSYGQKKRIAIASVLAMKQEVVLLDEPTAGLDPVSVERMVQIIEGMKASHITTMLSSHDMDFIYKVCDYIYVIDNGQIVSEGTSEFVFSKQANLKEVGLAEPWLMKVHKYMGLPLFKTEEELFSYCKTNNSQ